MRATPRLSAQPLAVWERDGLRAALSRAKLPVDDIGQDDILFWRFETRDGVPAGFGGLEVHGEDALLRSIVTLPQLRRIGMGRAIVQAIELEARLRKCRAIYLLTTSEAAFFTALGYAPLDRKRAPKPIQQSRQFASLCPDTAALMRKALD
jgi:N-acetylglutamate synthase-like GNAT family acetyltransferase